MFSRPVMQIKMESLTAQLGSSHFDKRKSNYLFITNLIYILLLHTGHYIQQTKIHLLIVLFTSMWNTSVRIFGYIDLECRCQHKIQESCRNRLGENISLYIFGFTQNY